MHDAAFAALGMAASYEVCDIDVAGLAAAMAALRAPACIGANITIPHKVAACYHVDALAPEVARLGAANTIVRHRDRLVAHNTDLAALAAELELLPLAGPVVVLGRGGASRAVVAALADRGVERVTVVGRDRWDELPALLPCASLVVNATPVGTGDRALPFDPRLLRGDLAVLDLVYRPSPTGLVAAARATGATARDGSGMLLRQAAASFALWTEREPPLDAMRDALARELGVPIDA